MRASRAPCLLIIYDLPSRPAPFYIYEKSCCCVLHSFLNRTSLVFFSDAGSVEPGGERRPRDYARHRHGWSSRLLSCLRWMSTSGNTGIYCPKPTALTSKQICPLIFRHAKIDGCVTHKRSIQSRPASISFARPFYSAPEQCHATMSLKLSF